MSRFSAENFWSHSAEKRRRVILSSFIKFGYRKSLDKRGEGKGVQQFSVERFCLTMPKFFVGEPLCAVSQKNSGSEKLYG